jgi:hypothetical protein
MGYISRAKTINETVIRKAIIYGSIMASFTVEDFSVNRLLEITKLDIAARFNNFKKITRF